MLSACVKWSAVLSVMLSAVSLMAEGFSAYGQETGQNTTQNESQMHSLYPENLPTGAVSGTSLYRGVAGQVQIVEIRLPDGTLISPALPGGWDTPETSRLWIGLQVGNVYRFRVGNIPYHAADEVYPTVELFDRLYTPDVLRTRFPLQIELTQSDLEYATAGKLVIRVVYLEDPETAFPVADSDRSEGLGSYDLAPGDDPLAIADLMGRPLAIIRLGGRTPTNPTNPDATFTFGTPSYARMPAGTDSVTMTGDDETMRMVDHVFMAPLPCPDTVPCPDVPASHDSFGAGLGNMSEGPCVGNPFETSEFDRGRGEYLLNGGDRDRGEHGIPAGFPIDGEIPGLDAGDAVATYETTNGMTELLVINRVPIYSPRFGSIRKVIGLAEQSISVGWRDLHQHTLTSTLGARDVVAVQKQHEAPRGAQGALQASTAHGSEGLSRAETSIGLAMHRDSFAAWENFQQIRTGQTDSAEGPQLTASVAAARSWEQPEEVKVFFGDDVVSAFTRIDGAAEIYFVKDDETRYGKLQVTKVASASDALPGEFVEFTLRYDNIGDAEITKVRIADSLNPRLEYVENSAESSIPTRFSTRQNLAGSFTLEWELTRSLQPGEGGIIRFRTKVR